MIHTPFPHRQQVQSYINTCGIVDPIVRKQLFDFSDGIYDLGLWNSMVCWPMGYRQNTITGNMVQSLGGLGVYAGTLSGNYSRTVSGMAFSGGTMATSVITPGTPSALIFVMRQDGAYVNNSTIFATAGENISGRQFYLGDGAVPNAPKFIEAYGSWPPAYFNFARSEIITPNMNYMGFRNQSDTSMTLTANATQDNFAMANNWLTSSPAFTQFGIYNTDIGVTLPLFSYFQTVITDAQDIVIRNIVKNTLGSALGLP